MRGEGVVWFGEGLGRGERMVVWFCALVNKNWTEKIKICTIKTKTQTEPE